MTSEIRLIELLVKQPPASWRWRDAVTGETGTAVITETRLHPGDLVVAELHRAALSWKVTRLLDRCNRGGQRRLSPLDLEPIPPPSPQPTWTDPRKGELRLTRSNMDGRSTADRDAGRDFKTRPAVVVWVDTARQQAGIRLVFGTNSRARRNGLGRRLHDWKAAGLHKPSVVAPTVLVRAFSELGPRLGTLGTCDAWASHSPRQI